MRPPGSVGLAPRALAPRATSCDATWWNAKPNATSERGVASAPARATIAAAGATRSIPGERDVPPLQ